MSGFTPMPSQLVLVIGFIARPAGTTTPKCSEMRRNSDGCTASGHLSYQRGAAQHLEVVGELLAARKRVMAGEHIHVLAVKTRSRHIGQRPELMGGVVGSPVDVVEVHRLAREKVAGQNAIMDGSAPMLRRRSMISASLLPSSDIAAAAVSPPKSGASRSADPSSRCFPASVDSLEASSDIDCARGVRHALSGILGRCRGPWAAGDHCTGHGGGGPADGPQVFR